MHTKHAVHDPFHVHVQQQSMFKLHQLDKKHVCFVLLYMFWTHPWPWHKVNVIEWYESVDPKQDSIHNHAKRIHCLMAFLIHYYWSLLYIAILCTLASLQFCPPLPFVQMKLLSPYSTGYAYFRNNKWSGGMGEICPNRHVWCTCTLQDTIVILTQHKLVLVCRHLQPITD